MERQQRYLKKVTSNALPGNWIVFDVIYERKEKRGTSHAMQLVPLQIHWMRWRVRDGRQCCMLSGVCNTVESWWREIEQFCCPSTTTWIMSCSAYTDWTAFGLWQQILDGKVVIHDPDMSRPESDKQGGNRTWQGYTVTEDPPTIIVARIPERRATINIVDVRNYSAKWRPSYDVPSTPYSEDGFTPIVTAKAEIERSKSRVNRLHKFACDLTAWLRDNKLGTLKPTFASQGLSIFRHSYLEDRIEIHTDDAALGLERRAYYGGRCECKFIGRKEMRLHQVDINSLYPFCAAGFPLPIKFFGRVKEPTMLDFNDAIGCMAVIADVNIRVDRPVAPWRQHDKILYPIGTFRTTLCGPELLLVRQHGEILKINDMALYYMGRPMAKFFAFMLTQRMRFKNECNDDMASFLKMASNGIIGKLGQRNKRWIRADNDAADEPFSCWWQPNPATRQLTIWRSFARRVSYLSDDGEGYTSIPSLAAYVCSYARGLLWIGMERAGFDNVYYYDTDSLWVNEQGLENLFNAGLVDNVEFGKFKHVDAYSAVEFRGIKHYLADGRLVCAGLPNSGKLSHDWKAEFWESRKVASDLWASKTPFAELVLRKWSSTKPYYHGQVLADGSVVPWRLTEIE